MRVRRARSTTMPGEKSDSMMRRTAGPDVTIVGQEVDRGGQLEGGDGVRLFGGISSLSEPSGWDSMTEIC